MSLPSKAGPRRLFGAPTSKEPVSGPVFIHRFVERHLSWRDSWSSPPPYSSKSRFSTAFCYRSEQDGRSTDGWRTVSGRRTAEGERRRRSTPAPCLPNIVGMRSLPEEVRNLLRQLPVPPGLTSDYLEARVAKEGCKCTSVRVHGQ